MRANQEIRDRAERNGIFCYQIARKLGKDPTAFSRKMRFEMPSDEKEKVMTAIDSILQERREYDEQRHKSFVDG